MRHRAPRPFVDFWHRLPRATALRLGRLRPVRVLATLAVALGLGIGGYVALASVMGGSSTPRAEVAAPADPGSGELPPPAGGSSASGDRSPAVSGSPSTTPTPGAQPPPSPTSEASPSTRANRGQVTGTPDAELVTPSTSTPQPSATVSASPEDTTPPDTSLTEEYPEPDEALFSFTSNETASFSCSLDGAAYASCGSPTHYRDLEAGWHTLAVRAVDAAGNTDPSPAETRWLATAALPEVG